MYIHICRWRLWPVCLHELHGLSNSLRCYWMVRTNHQILCLPNNALVQIIGPPLLVPIPPPFREGKRLWLIHLLCYNQRQWYRPGYLPPPWEGAIRISDKRNIAPKIQPMIREIIDRLIIAVWVGDEEVQASNNSSWFTNNLAPCKSKYRDLRLNCCGWWPRDIY